MPSAMHPSVPVAVFSCAPCGAGGSDALGNRPDAGTIAELSARDTWGGRGARVDALLGALAPEAARA
jgi:hypothetical protein